MHVSTALARFLPTDPGYTPFGLRLLRGLNVLPFALVGFVALVWTLSVMFVPLPGRNVPLAPDLYRSFYQFFFSLVSFTPMLLLITAADNLSAAWRPAARIGLLAATTLLGALILVLIWQPLNCLSRPPAVASEREACRVFFFSWGKVATFTRGTLWGALFTTVLYLHKRERNAHRALHAAHLRYLNSERQETEARLRSLQAQIEPHFLFNTLAHIQRLCQVRPAQGRAMLRNLVEYLRSALPQMRVAESTLGRELALAQAYLNVQRIRMGERLQVEVDVPESLADARLPPMMLVTLVENAIKHGLGPKRRGGTVRVSAREANGCLEIEVNDDGVGLMIGAGTGRGLANTRARLAMLFGAAGTLEVANGATSGVCATLALPHVSVRREACVS